MKTIKTETHLLLVDETAEIKEGDWFYNTISIQQSQRDSGIRHPKSVKIIAASPKLGNLPEFETLPLNTEDDVERLALNFDKVKCRNFKREFTSKETYEGVEDGFIAGYKQAKSETMFSLEDMRNFANWINDNFNIEAGREHWTDYGLDENNNSVPQKEYLTKDLVNLYIQSLTKPKEYEFVINEPFEIKDNKVLGNWIIK